MTSAQEITQTTAARPVFDLFEGFATSSVLAGLEMAGMLDGLDTDGIREDRLGDRTDDPALLAASLRFLAQRGLLDHESGVFTLTGYGREVYKDKGYLVWLVGGYGEPLRRLDAMVGMSQRYGTDVDRDGRWVADGAAIIGRTDVVPYAMSLLENVPVTTVLDLGCGNARFLLALCDRFQASGVGVDNSPAACAVAEKNIAASGMSERVNVVCADAGRLDDVEQMRAVDVVTSLFLLHEILAQGRDVLIRYLRQMAARLPDGAHLLVAEIQPPRDAKENFTPEFTYVHAIMRQILYTSDEWTKALEDGGFTVVDVVDHAMPGGVLLLARKA